MAFSINDVVVYSDIGTRHKNWSDSYEGDAVESLVNLLAGIAGGDSGTLSKDETHARKQALGRLTRIDDSGDLVGKALVFCGSSEVSTKTAIGTFSRTCYQFKPIGGDDSSVINICFAGSTIYTREARMCSRFKKIGVVGSLNQDLVNAHMSSLTSPAQGVGLKVGSTAFDEGEHGSLDASGEVVPGDASTPSDFLCLVDMSTAGSKSVFVNLRVQGIIAVSTSALPSVSVGSALFQAASGALATTGTIPVAEVLATDSDTTVIKILGTYIAP